MRRHELGGPRRAHHDRPDPVRRATRLERWTELFTAALSGAPVDDPVLPAVLHTIAVFDLDRADFARFLRSMAMDLTVTEYPTYDDLLDYMEGSAAAIGTMMLPILGSTDPVAAREPARQLGFAFQLTNSRRSPTWSPPGERWAEPGLRSHQGGFVRPSPP